MMDNSVGAAEAEVGRWVYRRIEALMDAQPGTSEGAELQYLAAAVASVEEYGEENCQGRGLGAFPQPAAPLTDDQIKHMVNRFLGWQLPANFNPDAGITFKAEHSEEFMASIGKPPMRHEPCGTNLFDANQAEAMVRYMIEGMAGA